MKADWLQPTLNGTTIRLRPLVESDFEALYKSASDPEIWKMHSDKNRFERDVFQKFFDYALKPPGALAVEDLESSQIIGSSRFYDYDETQKQVVAGYTFLERAYWGGYTNGELKRLMLDYAFYKLGVDQVLFHVSEGNVPSRKSLERLGAQQKVGLLDIPGIGKRVEYFVIRERWPEIRARLIMN